MRGTAHTIELSGRKVELRLKKSASAQRIRVRVGLGGVEVVQPRGRSFADVEAFLDANRKWLLAQMTRAERLRSVRLPRIGHAGQILFRGIPTEVHIAETGRRSASNLVRLKEGRLLVLLGRQSNVDPAASLEGWLRRRAREAIIGHLTAVTAKLKIEAGKVYVMGQRTKWGNCSAMRNLSFNWRIVMAPDFVLRYLVTHEAVHLAVPDHSQRFWLTVQGLCPEAGRARGWLSANVVAMMVDLRRVLAKD